MEETGVNESGMNLECEFFLRNFSNVSNMGITVKRKRERIETYGRDTVRNSGEQEKKRKEKKKSPRRRRKKATTHDLYSPPPSLQIHSTRGRSPRGIPG
jgi:hypothetical protein